MSVRLLKSAFSLGIEGISSSKFSWEYEQSTNLTQLTFILHYKDDVAGKKVTLSYSTVARRLLSEISFDEDFVLESFPPAFYSEEERIQ